MVETIKFLKKHKITIYSMIFIFVLVDILVLKTMNDVRLFAALFTYTIIVSITRTKNRLTFIFAFGLFSVLLISLILKAPSVVIERASSWLYFFLLVGIIQLFRK